MTTVDKNMASRNDGNSLISNVSTFIDTNVRAFRNTLYIVGGISILWVGRSLYISKVFRRVDEIPAHFIRKHVRLLGMVRQVTDNGILHIEHTPALRLRLPYTRVKPVTPLPVHLACIEMTPAGLRWLQNTVIDKKVWIRPLVRIQVQDHSRLYSQVEVSKRFRNIKVNERLVETGLCKVAPLTSIQDATPLQLSSNKTLADYVNTLVSLEAKAARKQAGLWKGYKSPATSSWSRHGVGIVKTVVTSPVRAIKWLYKRWKK